MESAEIKQLSEAYVRGDMQPEEEKTFVDFMASSGLPIPEKVKIAPMIDEGILEAYNTPGEMSRQEAMDFEDLISKGLFSVPEGTVMRQTKAAGFLEGIKESITGEDQTTPEIEAMPDWTFIPELRDNSWAGFKASIGTLSSTPEETATILKTNFPDLVIASDRFGNIILTSSIDGKKYAIKKGLRQSDIAQAVPTTLAYIPAGKAASVPLAALAHGGTQAAIEGSQVLAGGEFNPEEVITSAAMGGGFTAGGKTIGALRGKSSPIRELTREAETTATVDALRKASQGGLGSKRATQVLAMQTAPDQKALEAAQRLGILEYLQPDHVSTNQVYREVIQAVKSNTGSRARAAELEGFVQVAKRADDLIEELGGTVDLSTLESTIKSRMKSTQSDLDEIAKTLYQELDNIIPPKEQNPAINVVTWLEGRAEDLGGVKNLEPVGKEILSRLYSVPIKENGKIVGYKHPTYALLDKTRKDLTAARIKSQGQDIFKNADKGLLKKIESELLKDQKSVVEKFGLLKTFETAQLTTAARKGLESDMKSIFGKYFHDSMIGDLSQSFKRLTVGDVSKFTKLISAIPEDMRKEVTASGLLTAFGKVANGGNLSFTNYAKWYQGLIRNKKAYHTLMDNLPKESRKRLSDLYRISRSLSLATKERTVTGRSGLIQKQLNGAEGLVSKVYGATKKLAKGAVAEAALVPFGLKGAGVMWGLASGLTKNKPDIVKAADNLLLSYAFKNAVTEFGTKGERGAVTKLAKSNAFRNFAEKIQLPRKLPEYERWILASLQSGRQLIKEENGNIDNRSD